MVDDQVFGHGGSDSFRGAASGGAAQILLGKGDSVQYWADPWRWTSRQGLPEEPQDLLGKRFGDFQLRKMSDVLEEPELIGTRKGATCGIESRLVNDVSVSRDDQAWDVDLAVRRRRPRSFFARFSE